MLNSPTPKYLILILSISLNIHFLFLFHSVCLINLWSIFEVHVLIFFNVSDGNLWVCLFHCSYVCYHFLQKYHCFISWRPKGTQFSLIAMSIFFFFYYYGRVSNLEYYTGERESEIVLGYLDIHTTAIHFL